MCLPHYLIPACLRPLGHWREPGYGVWLRFCCIRGWGLGALPWLLRPKRSLAVVIVWSWFSLPHSIFKQKKKERCFLFIIFFYYKEAEIRKINIANNSPLQSTAVFCFFVEFIFQIFLLCLSMLTKWQHIKQSVSQSVFPRHRVLWGTFD